MGNGLLGRYFAASLTAGALICGIGGAYAQPEDSLPLDNPTQISGIETVCTGVGLEARGDPRWDAYSLRVELAGKGGQYLGDVRVTVSKDNKLILATTCGGPWALFKLPPARYQVDATIENKTVSSIAYVPASGQGRIILRFPEMGGALEQPIEPVPQNENSEADYN